MTPSLLKLNPLSPFPLFFLFFFGPRCLPKPGGCTTVFHFTKIEIIGSSVSGTMVEAWLMDDSDADQRLPHKREPHAPLSLDDLKTLGVLYWCVFFS